VQNLHNLLWSIDYKMPLAHRHTEEEMASKLLICMSKFDTFLHGKCHDIINGEPGQRGSWSAARLSSRTMRTASQRPRASTITP